MKGIIILLLFSFEMYYSFAQTNKYYSTTGTEFIFQFADALKEQQSIETRLRFSLFYHFEQQYHFDSFKNSGFFTGFGIRNVGFITKGESTDNPASNLQDYEVKIKRRVYTLGVPIAFKYGNLEERFYLFSGAELEFPFHYKQKLFIDGKKENKKTDWFSDRTNWYLPSVFGGIQFPGGLNIKFKYYLRDLIRDDYTYPYQGFDYDENFTKSQMFHISVSFHIINKRIKNSIQNNQERFTLL